MDQDTLENRKRQASAWFKTLQEDLCGRLELLEESAGKPLYKTPAGRFQLTAWQRGEPDSEEDLGGGRMGLMRGRVFEKAGVHFSEVQGSFSEAFAAQIPGAAESGGQFWASGVSVIIHPRNPRVPAAHMNTRMLVTSDTWFGGGGDLTPVLSFQRRDDFEDTVDFHAAMGAACAVHPGVSHADLKAECDTYFHLAHRNEPRGTGGIFYDRFNSGDWDQDFAFTQEVGRQFVDAYVRIAGRRMNEPWTEDEREEQLIRRGRYVEFNLLYDRGTTFGLKTGGNVESILSSMPPLVKWP